MGTPAANEGQQGRVLPRTSEGVSLALHAQLQASVLECQETVSSWGFKAPSWWLFINAALGETYNMDRAHFLLTQFLQKTPNLKLPQPAT